MISDTEYAKALFFKASGAATAAIVLGQRGHYDADLSLPSVISAAFSLELYLRSMLALEKKFPPKVLHDLLDLFIKLSPETQGAIRSSANPLIKRSMKNLKAEATRLNAPIAKLPSSVEECLARSRNAFVGLRYIFESKNDVPAEWFGTSISNATRDAILSRHPEWGEASG